MTRADKGGLVGRRWWWGADRGGQDWDEGVGLTGAGRTGRRWWEVDGWAGWEGVMECARC